MKALTGAGHEGILEIRSGKEFLVTINYETKDEANAAVEEMCKQLLANRVTDNYEFTIEFEEPVEEVVPVIEVDLADVEIKFPMGEKLVILGESKELTDEDCLFLITLLYDYHKSGKFQAWLDRETRRELIDRSDKVFKKLFGRANKCIFTKGDGAAFANTVMKSVDAKYEGSTQ